MNLEKKNSQSSLFGANESDLRLELTTEGQMTEAEEKLNLAGTLDQDSVMDSNHEGHCLYCHGGHCHGAHLHGANFENLPSDEINTFNAPGAKWFQPGGRGNPVDITYSFAEFGNFNGISAEEAKAAVEEAFELWASVTPINFTEVEDNSGTSQIRINQEFVDGRGGTLAFAFFPSNGDITFDSSENWTPGTFLETAVHEVGHSLGLGHEEEVQAILNPSLQGRFNGLGSSFLLPDDIEGIQSLYGSGTGVVNALADNIPPTATVNLGIEATEGDDILVGNNAANQIVGLGGDDLIEGGLGLDTITGGDGADTFVFSSLDGSIDIIRDYSLEQGDRIEVIRAGFGSGEFGYDANSGGLFYEEQQFAILENIPDFETVLPGFTIT